MLSHIVIFWLKEDLSENQKKMFQTKITALKKIEYAHSVHIGPPKKLSDRPIIDTSFSYAINSVFKTVEDHDSYQAHPLHRDFLETCVPMCSKVQIFDFE